MVNGKHLFVFVGLLALGFAGFMLMNSGNKPAAVPDSGSCGPSGCVGTGMAVGDSSIKEFTITAKKYSFEPSTITVNKGDRVRITLKNADVSHGISISEFGINLAAPAGQEATAEFVADKAGTFNFFCSIYCGDGHPEMAGKLIVNDGSAAQAQQAGGQEQVVTLRGTPRGYDKSSITVKAGQPVKFQFSADPNSGCGRQVIIDNVGVNIVSKSGETVTATFTPPSPGQYKYHCSMNMFRGVLIAT